MTFAITQTIKEEQHETQSRSSTIYNSLTRSSTVNSDNTIDDPADGQPVKKIRAETDSTKLKQFLNNLDGE